ncbi:hypothetical protein J53TS2_37750 [Paenibacillus sp. J53TS2]|nr:hypothetical protein J53TS2_37750 [Paenibacillus sp. J53TS2]
MGYAASAASNIKRNDPARILEDVRNSFGVLHVFIFMVTFCTIHKLLLVDRDLDTEGCP